MMSMVMVYQNLPPISHRWSKTQVGVWADRSGSNNSLHNLCNKQPVYDQTGGINKMLFGVRAGMPEQK